MKKIVLFFVLLFPAIMGFSNSILFRNFTNCDVEVSTNDGNFIVPANSSIYGPFPSSPGIDFDMGKFTTVNTTSPLIVGYNGGSVSMATSGPDACSPYGFITVTWSQASPTTAVEVRIY